MSEFPVSIFHSEKQGKAQGVVVSCETIGIPTGLAFAILNSDEKRLLDPTSPIFPFTIALPLTFPVINAIVQDVRSTDTPLAYDMGRTFARGVLVDKSINWKPLPLLEAQWQALQKTFPSLDFEIARRAYLTMHFKRSKGICKNPLNPEHDILAVISNVELGLKWFDISASNDPTQKIHWQPKPKRRPNAFIIEDSSLPSYKQSCLQCSNRSQKGKNYSKCGKCHLARYCSRDCQRLDWEVHKGTECKTMATSIDTSD